MYGPCFDNHPSTPMVCMQHPALFPPDVLGQYYYPIQKEVPPPPGITDTQIGLMAIHPFLQPQNVLPFSAWPTPGGYGLGKDAVMMNMGTFVFKDATTGQVDNATVSVFLSPFSGNNWPKWAQLHCSAGCHRDAMYTQRTFATNDPLFQVPQYWALSRLQAADPANPPGSSIAVNCVQCPPGHGVYARTLNLYGGAAYNLLSAPFIQVCRPWFGALPVIINGAMQVSVAPHPAGQYITSPSVGRAIFASTLCPVNTYNRLCADTWVYQVSAGLAEAPSCTPCSSVGAGWHTGGAVGAWFCLPPPGFHFLQSDYLTSRAADGPYWANGTQWRPRDRWRFELECDGTQEPQCQQCAAVGHPEYTSDQFNWNMIFQYVLEVTNIPHYSA